MSKARSIEAAARRRTLTRRIYIESHYGLCNRMETFVLAVAISRAFGHEIFLNWPELDVVRVQGARRGGPGLLGRWGALRLRTCDSEEFKSLKHRRKIILRGFGGPEPEMASAYLEAISRFSLEPRFAESVARVLDGIGSRPVVGVHLRRGDFPEGSGELYDLSQQLLSAVPVWWHEWVMQAIVKRQPEVCFLVCHNGDSKAVSKLKANFDIVEVPIVDSYKKQPGHDSRSHPVADLVALASCPVILATPVSSFSHYAANILGAESVCLMPPPRMNRSAPAVVRSNVHRRTLQAWVNTCRFGWQTEALKPSLDGMDFHQPVRTNWFLVGGSLAAD